MIIWLLGNGKQFLWVGTWSVACWGEEGGCVEKDGWRVDGDQISKILVNQDWLLLEGLKEAQVLLLCLNHDLSLVSYEEFFTSLQASI